MKEIILNKLYWRWLPFEFLWFFM